MRSSASLPALSACRSPAGLPQGLAPQNGGASLLSTTRSSRLGSPVEVAYHKSHEFQRNFEDAYEGLSRNRNIVRLERLFLLTDVDGSGDISVEEFCSALRLAPTQAMFARLGIQPHQAMLFFKAFDTNGDGMLSLEEFLNGLMRLCSPDAEGCCTSEIDTDMLRAANFNKPSPIDTSSPKAASKVKPCQLPDLNLITQDRLQRAFVHSALSQALHPVSASASRAYRRAV
mmetsp:Transcript_86362/g.241678  ORF Transcript_86362/g.241678 Transcript_86362/m.241678 type:complete len:230 (+) Transcript_86362:118-807(+)